MDWSHSVSQPTRASGGAPIGFVIPAADSLESAGTPVEAFERAHALINEVVREDGPALRRFLLAHTRDANEADDLLQDLYMRLLQSSTAIDLARSRRAYLLSMARNLLRDRHRHLQARARALAEFGEEHVGQFEPSRQEIALQVREGYAAAARAMARLRPKHRAIYQLSRMQGLRHDEIAKQLGVSLRSVERHVSEISVYMRQTLEACI